MALATGLVCFKVNKGAECRLLPQPLYRFDAPEQGILDGAIFAFVVANDPDLLLTVTLRSPPVSWKTRCGTDPYMESLDRMIK